MGCTQSKSVQVVTVDKDGNPKYDGNAVRNVLKVGPGKSDTEVFVICMSGVYRSGKTFLLNLFKTYLDHYCQKHTYTGWQEANYKIVGGVWADGEHAVTDGIWMYMYPELISGKGVILMDCQGNEDIRDGSPTLDNLILFLALHLSDVHVLNVDKRLRADDFNRLGMCILHAAEDGCSESLFERQMFLIRDWPNTQAPTQLDEKIEEARSPDKKQAGRGIKNAFKETEIWSLPHPGSEIEGKSEKDNVLLCHASKEFRAQAEKLFSKLVVDYLVTSKGRNSTKGRFVENFQFLSRRAVAHIKSPKEAYEESLIKAVLEECTDYFVTEVRSNWNMAWKDTSVWKMKVEQCYGQAVVKFNSHRRVVNCENPSLKADYLKYLQDICTDTMELIEEMFEMERRDPEIERIRKAEENRIREIKRLQSQLDEVLEEVKTLKRRQVLIEEEAELKVAAESLKMTEEIAKQKERMRDEEIRRQDQAHAERVRRIEAQAQKIREERERLRNPSIAEAAIIFGKSLVNNLIGKLFWL